MRVMLNTAVTMIAQTQKGLGAPNGANTGFEQDAINVRLTQSINPAIADEGRLHWQSNGSDEQE